MIHHWKTYEIPNLTKNNKYIALFKSSQEKIPKGQKKASKNK